MKHLNTFEINHRVTKFSKLNESNTIHDGNVEDALFVDGVAIDLDYDMDCDDDYIIYTLYLNGTAIHKLANVGVVFEEIDYVELEDSNKIDIYQVSIDVSEKKLRAYGVDTTSELDASDAYDLIESKIKFKFGKKFTAKEFVKYFNNVLSNSSYMGDEHTAVLKDKQTVDKLKITTAQGKALSQFLGTLTQKDYFFLGKDETYFENLPKFKALNKLGISVEDAVAYCLKAVGVDQEWQKNPKVLKANSKTGILD